MQGPMPSQKEIKDHFFEAILAANLKDEEEAEQELQPTAQEETLEKVSQEAENTSGKTARQQAAEKMIPTKPDSLAAKASNPEEEPKKQ